MHTSGESRFRRACAEALPAVAEAAWLLRALSGRWLSPDCSRPEASASCSPSGASSSVARASAGVCGAARAHASVAAAGVHLRRW